MLQAGDRVGRYEIQAVVGEGGFEREVAIKVMRKSLCEDQVLVDRFLGEARALAALNHRNVVQIYSLGKEKGRPYIVMELAPGGGLRERMKSGPPPPEDEVKHLGDQLIDSVTQQVARELAAKIDSKVIYALIEQKLKANRSDQQS